MSGVLRKKIELSAGLPPSLARNEVFWRHLLSQLNTWADESFGASSFFAVDSRRVCRGAVIETLLANREVACFDDLASPGFCALAVDDVTMTALAANRLGVLAEDLEETPALLKRLVFATAASSLWARIATLLPDHDAETAIQPLTNRQGDEERFEPSQAYLLVNTASGEIGAGHQISIVMNLAFLMGNLSQLATDLAAPTAKISSEGSAEMLRAAALDANVKLDAVVDRLDMTLADCYRLDVGQVLLLEDSSRKSVGLEVQTAKGASSLGKASMGVWKARRAIRVEALAEPEKIQSSLADGFGEATSELTGVTP